MSDELVERVAKSIHISMGNEGSSLPWREFIPEARAAIAAVRAHDAETGPSEAEIQASFHERGTFFRGEVRGILRAAAVERARGEVG